MPFQPPAETLAYWRNSNPKLASDADIALLEGRLGGKAPTSYVAFIETYGDVEFSTVDTSNMFEYVYQEPDRTERRKEAIAFIKAPERALQYYEGLQKDPKVNLPPNLLPFGMDYGQGELLIEFGQPTERVFYWDFDAHDWETGVTRLGFVANDMYEFINNLQPFDR